VVPQSLNLSICPKTCCQSDLHAHLVIMFSFAHISISASRLFFGTSFLRRDLQELLCNYASVSPSKISMSGQFVNVTPHVFIYWRCLFAYLIVIVRISVTVLLLLSFCADLVHTRFLLSPQGLRAVLLMLLMHSFAH
jgi:hypothetical protein